MSETVGNDHYDWKAIKKWKQISLSLIFQWKSSSSYVGLSEGEQWWKGSGVGESIWIKKKIIGYTDN